MERPRYQVCWYKWQRITRQWGAVHRLFLCGGEQWVREDVFVYMVGGYCSRLSIVVPTKGLLLSYQRECLSIVKFLQSPLMPLMGDVSCPHAIVCRRNIIYMIYGRIFLDRCLLYDVNYSNMHSFTFLAKLWDIFGFCLQSRDQGGCHKESFFP